ncbi:MAG: PKD domain-containing protein [Bacteroidia bacterium]
MKFKLILLGMLLLTGLPGSPLKAQNLIVNGTFDVNTPVNTWNCDVSPWAWQASVSSSYAPLTGMQWVTFGAPNTWWIDMSDCQWGNNRWVKQTVTTAIGQTYIIGLNLLAPPWAPSGVDLYLNGTLVAHFDNTNNGTPGVDDWERFEFCWTATSTSTEVKLVGNSSVGSACPVIGIDSVVMIDTDSIDFEITLTDKCAPATVCFQTNVLGRSTWYYNGSFLDSGVHCVTAGVPGTYKIEFITVCGDTLTKDTVVIQCDTCKPDADVRDFCLGQSTLFNFNFVPDCLSPDCLGDFTLNYGDGSSDVVTPGNLLAFSHTYSAIGTYAVLYCWNNLCDSTTSCDTLTINIIDCDTCKPEVNIREFCEGEPTYFDFDFSRYCAESGCIGSVTIDYGDGGTDVYYGGGPFTFSHVYAAAGTYTVIYCWADNCTGKTKCDTVTVIIKDCSCPPEVDIQKFCLGDLTTFQFTFDPECAGCVGDMTIDFGDGSSASGPAPYFFSHVYPAAGTYTVTYCWVNHCKGQTYCKTVSVVIVECPCEPIEEVWQFCVGQPTNFRFTFDPSCEDCIMDMTIDYGDGSGAAGGAPYLFSHTYGAPGVYTVTYCWTNSCTGLAYCKTIIVTIVDCPCEPVPDIREFCFGQRTLFDFLFDPECEPCMGQMTVDFGDGTMLLAPGAPYSFSHTYPAPGNYTVKYCWTDNCTGQVHCKTVIITIVECVGEPAPNSVSETLNQSLSLFPNPAQNKVILRGITKEKGVSRVVVLSIDGKQVLSLPVGSETTELEIPLDKLSSGSYLVRVMGEQPTVNLKLIKE